MIIIYASPKRTKTTQDYFVLKMWSIFYYSAYRDNDGCLEASQLFDTEYLFPKSTSTKSYDHDWLFNRQKLHLAEQSWCIYYHKALVIMADIAVLSGFAQVKHRVFTTTCIKLILAGWLLERSFLILSPTISFLWSTYFWWGKYWLFTKTHGSKKQHLSNP